MTSLLSPVHLLLVNLVGLDFVDVSNAQYDALVLVLYSDVEEWYSQHRIEADRPFASLGFLATSFIRAFRDPLAAKSITVRREVAAPTQLYWGGEFYSGTMVEINSRSARLELTRFSLPNVELLRRTKPSVGLLVRSDEHDSSEKKLIVEVAHVESIKSDRLYATDSPMNAVAEDVISIELSFPKQLDWRQGNKIRHLLIALDDESRAI